MAAESHHDRPSPPWLGLARLVDGAWATERPVAADLDLMTGPIVAGPDGTLWAYVVACERAGELLVSGASWCLTDDGAVYRRYLARFDGMAWTTYSERLSRSPWDLRWGPPSGA